MRDGGPRLSAAEVRASAAPQVPPEAAPDRQVEIADPSRHAESTADIEPLPSGTVAASSSAKPPITWWRRSLRPRSCPSPNLPGVQSIYPHGVHRRSATTAPRPCWVSRRITHRRTTLNGSEQIVHVAIGLDTGDPATVHADIRGRGDRADQPSGRCHEGRGASALRRRPADIHSGHGTHDQPDRYWATARRPRPGRQPAGPEAAPAPAAQVYFSAVEQTVTCEARQARTPGRAARRRSPGWPPPAVGLNGLPADLTTPDQGLTYGGRAPGITELDWVPATNRHMSERPRRSTSSWPRAGDDAQYPDDSRIASEAA